MMVVVWWWLATDDKREKERRGKIMSLAVAGMMIAGLGVRATTRSAAHMGSSSGLAIGLSSLRSNGTLLFRLRSLRFKVLSGSSNGSTSSEAEAYVCIQN
ncbi:hypothetical protein Tco_1430443 [Tanacetum coccineum]